MTHDEFREWFKHHVTSFTGVGSWLASFPTVTQGNQPTQAQVRMNWYRVLEHTDLADARAATDSLFRGDDQFPEKSGFDCHPATVRKIAKRHSAFRVRPAANPNYNREETYKCLQCRDVGLVHVWHPQIVREARRDRETWLAVGKVYSACVCCSCQSGERWASKGRSDNREASGRLPIRMFNANLMPIYPDPFCLSGGKQELLKWLDENGQKAYEVHWQEQHEFT